MQFEKNLVLLRKKNGMSQDELAYAIGVSRQTIYSWEAGLNYPNIIMLKKLANILEVSTDELLNGFEVNKLPKSIDSLKLTFISKHEGMVVYNELPNWFVSLNKAEEISFGQYDLVKDILVRDYSYHLEVKGDIQIHDVDGLILDVKEYNPVLELESKYEYYVTSNEDGVSFIGLSKYELDKKIIKTFKDEDFLIDYGLDGKFLYQNTKFNDAEDYILEYDGRKINVVKISYIDNGYYVEVFLNQKNESLVWIRYSNQKNKKKCSNVTITKDNIVYDLDYYCITSRL